MADFVKIHEKNVRFSVNRSLKIKIKLSETELQMWLALVKVLQDRRNTGPQIETLLYLFRKYEPKITPAKITGRNGWKTVGRDKQLFFKVNKEEYELWENVVTKYKSSQVETFMHIVDTEFTFQDSVEIINEEKLSS